MYLRYKWDIFFATRLKIILFHLLVGIVMVLLSLYLINYVREVTLSSFVDSLRNIIERGGVVDLAPFTASAREITIAQFTVFAVIISFVTITGVVSAWLALRPVRKAVVMQRRFIASVAHELRTPLAILKTENEVARFDIADDSPLRDLIDHNVDEVDRLTDILNNLLLFNRVDTLESIRFETTDLSALLERVTLRLKGLATKKGVALRYERGAEVPHVYGNPVGLEQAFFNIIRNAVHYTNPGGEVVIWGTTNASGEVSVHVSDTGIGISGREIGHIFEPFYRTESGQMHGRGSGLGLAIVFEIIKLHNGRIGVESVVGKGTTFTVSIPSQPSAVITGRRQQDPAVAYDFSTTAAAPGD